MSRRRPLGLILVLLAAAGTAQPVEAERPPEPEPPPAAVRGAPWYDPQADTWRRVAPRPEPQRQDRGPAGGAPLFAYVMYAVVAAAVILLALQLWRLVRFGGGGALPEAPAPGVATTTTAALPFALPAADGDPEAALAAALAAGDLGLAMAWLYALQLLALDAAGVVRLAAGKTNRAYVREAQGRPQAAAVLARTVDAFERSWFGHQPPTRTVLDALLAAHRSLATTLRVAP